MMTFPALGRRLLGVVLALSALTFGRAQAPSIPAFPGAEGFGATTPGGRGGKVIFVTTLEDSGPGSLRAACDATGPRIVIFRVSGTIVLKNPITVRNPFLTIAGQSAPGDGICVRDATFGIATHDVVIRYMRFRLGDETTREADCLDLLHGARNCVIDHCSATWSIDECLSLSGDVQNCTIQWSLIGESLNQSKHAKGKHGYGSLSRANGPISWHHNLWIHNDARNPRLGDNYGRGSSPLFDVRNNLIYNYGGTASGLTQGKFQANYVANYIRPGPSSRAKAPITVGDKSDLQFFIEGNIFESSADLTRDNTRFFQPAEFRSQVRTVTTAFAAPPVTTVPAAEVMDLVLATVGASLPQRDAADARLVGHVRSRAGKLIDSQTEVGGFPFLKSGPAPADGDGDGMPDEWETKRGLNPRDASDGAADANKDGYTNLEEYLNGLVKMN
jgi:pectate lyase